MNEFEFQCKPQEMTHPKPSACLQLVSHHLKMPSRAPENYFVPSRLVIGVMVGDDAVTFSAWNSRIVL